MLRVIAGIIVGYLIFVVPSYLLFRLTHVDPQTSASLAFEVTALILGMISALLVDTCKQLSAAEHNVDSAPHCHPRRQCNFLDGRDQRELVADRMVNPYDPGSGLRRLAALRTRLSKTAKELSTAVTRVGRL